MHHGRHLDEQMKAETLREHFGATGRYPEGSLGSHDQGGLQFGITYDAEKRRVIVNFGTPVSWLGMNASHARDLGYALIRHASRLTSRPSGRRDV